MQNINSKKLRVGIAGFGVVGQRRRLFIDQHPQLKTVAVCDQKFKNSGEFEDGVRFCQSYKRLLEENLDVLFVCLVNSVAAEATCAGLQHGLHVFCEKPPGRNLDDITRVLVEQRRRPDLKLKYGFNHRYHDAVTDALRIVRSKELGEIVNLRGVYGKSKLISFGQNSDWRTQRALSGGGILLDQGIHMVDLIRLFAGEFDEIHSFISNDFWNFDVEDNAYALMRTKEGKVAMLHSTATQWRHRFHLDICLEKGSLNLSGILSGSKSYGSETLTVAWADDDGAGDPKEQTTRYNRDNSWRDEIFEFSECVIQNRPVTNGNAYDAYKTMELVYRIYCSDPEWQKKWQLSDRAESCSI